MGLANEYRQFNPYAANPQMAANPAEQGAFLAGAAQGAREAYAADQQRMAAQNAWQAQQAAAQQNGQATYAGVSALQAELSKNEAEIASLKEELNKLNIEVGDQDAIDRKLAANRAKIGDIGNSRAHQQDIQNRIQWRWQNKQLEGTKAKQSDAEVKAVKEKIIDAYREIAYAQDEQSRQVAEYNLQERLAEYQQLTGKEYTGNPFVTNTGTPEANQEAKTIEMAVGKLQKSFDKKGRPTQAAVDEFMKDAEKLPFSKELMDKVLEVQKMTTQEGAKKAYAASKKAVDDSFKQYPDTEIRTEMQVTGKDELVKTVNGKKVTFKKNGAGITRSSGGYSK